jgi:prepilin-type N-terminal cleavage/methylation domain-containing protein
MRPTDSRRGFSLVEVLASLVVTALLIVAFAPFVGQMLATWTRGGEAARLVELKTRGIGRLRLDLTNAIVWTGFGETGNLIAFRGNESSMSFPVWTPNGLEMLSITVDTSVDGRALVRREAAIIGSSYSTFRDPVILFSGQFKYLFKYFSRQNQESSTWTEMSEAPGRVELRIVDQKGQVFSAPIAMPLLASLSAACIVTAKLPGCPAGETNDEELYERLGLGAKTQ